MVNISFENGFSTVSTKLIIPEFYTVKNVIYKIFNNDYYRTEIWKDLVHDGDGTYRGILLAGATNFYNCNNITLKIFTDQTPHLKKTHYLSRLDVVKKLFDAFINRSIAYSFNTAIGLMSFSDKSKVECEITPFYESFRDRMDSLHTNGGTALYETLQNAMEKLTLWKNADEEKRSNARLRIICLSDGKDTQNSHFIYNIKNSLIMNNIVLDSIVIGSDFDNYLGKLSKESKGYIFNPSSIKHAFDIMEFETMIISKDRQKSFYFYNTINDTVIPPIETPNKSIKDKAVSVETVLDRINDSSKVIKKELLNIKKNFHPDIDVYINDNDIYFWKVIINGPSDTIYQNGCWLAYIQFPTTYPLVPPTIRFVTPIKHCNINNYGRVCHSILDRNYTPNVGISMILNCVYSLLLNPDTNDPLDTNLALLYYEANGQYEAEILEYIKKHAMKTREQWRTELI